MNIGLIGLGFMGAPMATPLARAGHVQALHGARAEAAAAPAQAIGGAARAAASPADLAAGCDIVITTLPHGEAVRDVALGASGLVHALQPGALLLDTSSAPPWLTRQTAAALQARAIAMVDAPVSGAQWGAQTAALVFMVGGASPDVARVRPLLDCMGRAIFHLGAPGRAAGGLGAQAWCRRPWGKRGAHALAGEVG